MVDLSRQGSIGSTLPSSDTRITTIPEDIVLYSSNQIVLFYDSNTWSYTKLGHINLSKSELTDLLGDESVVITLNLKQVRIYRVLDLFQIMVYT